MELENEILVAASWWARQLERPPMMENGDERQSRLLQHVANRTAVHDPIAPAAIRAFQAALTSELRALLKEDPHAGLSCLAVDYGPTPLLAQALRAAGITHGEERLPVKTEMYLEPGKVTVSRGYGAPDKVLYLEPKREGPTAA